MPPPICELTGRIYAGDRVKLKLKAESFNLLNRDNKRVQITEDGFMGNAPEFVQTDKTIGINIFPAKHLVPLQLSGCHRCLRAAPDPTRTEVAFLKANGSVDGC
jgi:hypothetical protein